MSSDIESILWSEREILGKKTRTAPNDNNNTTNSFATRRAQNSCFHSRFHGRFHRRSETIQMDFIRTILIFPGEFK